MKNDALKLIFSAYALLFAISLSAQLTILIEKVPSQTDPEDLLYLTGSFNNWNPADPNFQFNRLANGKAYFTFPKRMNSVMQFKVTRGDWTKVEAAANGEPLSVRKYYGGISRPDTLKIAVAGWEDFFGSSRPIGEVSIKIVDLPSNTPPDAPIYIVGDFNGWVPGDQRYRLQKQSDGNYAIDLPLFKETMAFKFTRGNWPTVEGKRNGRIRANRKFIYNPVGPKTIDIKIKSWEDLSGSAINPYTFILLLAAIQGLLLIVAIFTLQNSNLNANQILAALILLISLMLIGRVAVYDRDIYHWEPKLLLIPDFIYFLYAPLFLIYMRRLLKIKPPQSSMNLLFFVPALIQLLIYAQYFNEPRHIFVDREIKEEYQTFMRLFGALALIFNVFCWLKAKQLLEKYQENVENQYSFESNLQYLKSILQIKAACLFFWGLTFLVGILSILLNGNWLGLIEAMVDGIWIIFSLTVFFLGYYAIKQPEVFQVSESEEKDIPEAAEQEKILTLKQELGHLMTAEKPYLNPKLTLPELAQMANLNIHLLSKIINDGFQKNFYDFVNGYRIEEFKKLVLTQEYQHQTFLAIAYEVGFNSKTAFNRSFKKLTNLTPREYLKQQRISA